MDTSEEEREYRMKHRMPAIIFAGGKSSRMGQDKALLPFGGFGTLAQYQYERLQKYFDEVYISTKDEKFDFKAPLIHDRYTVHSPLAGIVSVFETLKHDNVFILSVDAPFVDNSVITKLMEEDEAQYDTVIARTEDGLQPLCGIYKRSILTLAREQLQQNSHRLGYLLQQAKSHEVFFEDEMLFSNLNHLHEYEAACGQLT